jgi:hypothetical protein
LSRVRSSLDELASFLSRSAAAFEERVCGLARALADGRPPDRPMPRLAQVLGETMALADLFGRRRVLLVVDGMKRGREVFAAPWPLTSFAATLLFPSLTFDEALKDLLTREPRLAPSARMVAELYSTKQAFALARSSELEVTARVQAALGKLIGEGVTGPKAERVVQEIRGWSRAYADTVYRTSPDTACTAGRFQQAADPDVAEVAQAFQRFAIRARNRSTPPGSRSTPRAGRGPGRWIVSASSARTRTRKTSGRPRGRTTPSAT